MNNRVDVWYLLGFLNFYIDTLSSVMFGEPYTLKPLTAVWFEQRFLKLPVKENLLNCKSTFNKENVIISAY